MSRLAHSNDHGFSTLDGINLPGPRCVLLPELRRRAAVDCFERFDLRQDRGVLAGHRFGASEFYQRQAVDGRKVQPIGAAGDRQLLQTPPKPSAASGRAGCY